MKKRLYLFCIMIIIAVSIAGCSNSDITEENIMAENTTEEIDINSEVLYEEQNNYEEFGEIIDGVQELSVKDWEKVVKILDQIDDYAVLVGSYETGWKIIYDGGHYEILQDESIYVIGKEMSEGKNVIIKVANENATIYNFEDFSYPFAIYVETIGNDIQVPVRIIHANGTIDYFSFSLNKDWE